MSHLPTSMTVFEAGIVLLDLHSSSSSAAAQGEQQALPERRKILPQSPFGTGTVLAELSAHEGSLLHFVALSHCKLRDEMIQEREDRIFGRLRRLQKQTLPTKESTLIQNNKINNNSNNTINRSASLSSSVSVSRQQQHQQSSAAPTATTKRTRSPPQQGNTVIGDDSSSPPSTLASPRTVNKDSHNFATASTSSSPSKADREAQLQRLVQKEKQCVAYLLEQQRRKLMASTRDSDVFNGTTRGVYAHCQKGARVILKINEEDLLYTAGFTTNDPNLLNPPSSGSFSFASNPSLGREFNDTTHNSTSSCGNSSGQQYQQQQTSPSGGVFVGGGAVGSANLAFNPSNIGFTAHTPNFGDLELSFVRCDVGHEESLPIFGFCPSRVKRIVMNKSHVLFSTGEDGGDGDGGGDSLDNGGTKAGDEASALLKFFGTGILRDGDDHIAGKTKFLATGKFPTSAPLVRKVVLDPCRWFASSLHLVLLPPANKLIASGGIGGSFIASQNWEKSGQQQHQQQQQFRDEEKSSSPSPAGASKSKQQSKDGGTTKSSSKAATAGSSKSVGGGGDNAFSATGAKSSTNNAAMASMDPSQHHYNSNNYQPGILGLVKKIAELDIADGGVYADEQLVEQWILKNAVRLPDGEFKLMSTTRNDQIKDPDDYYYSPRNSITSKRHAVSLTEALLTDNEREETATSTTASTPSMLLDKLKEAIFPAPLQIQRPLPLFNSPPDSQNKKQATSIPTQTSPQLQVVQQQQQQQQQHHPLLIARKKVAEFISAVDVYLASLSGGGIFSFVANRTRNQSIFGASCTSVATAAPSPSSPPPPQFDAMNPDESTTTTIGPAFGNTKTMTTPWKSMRSTSGIGAGAGSAATASTMKNSGADRTCWASSDRLGIGGMPPSRRLCDSISLLQPPPRRVEFANAFLDRYVIDEVLNARRIIAIEKLAASYVFSASSSASFPTAATAGGSSTMTQHPSVNPNLFASSPFSSSSEQHQQAHYLHQQQQQQQQQQQHQVLNEQNLNFVSYTTSAQKHQFVADVRSLADRDGLALASHESHVSLYDALSLVQHFIEFGMPLHPQFANLGPTQQHSSPSSHSPKKNSITSDANSKNTNKNNDNNDNNNTSQQQQPSDASNNNNNNRNTNKQQQQLRQSTQASSFVSSSAASASQEAASVPTRKGVTAAGERGKGASAAASSSVSSGVISTAANIANLNASLESLYHLRLDDCGADSLSSSSSPSINDKSSCVHCFDPSERISIPSVSKSGSTHSLNPTTAQKSSSGSGANVKNSSVSISNINTAGSGHHQKEVMFGKSFNNVMASLNSKGNGGAAGSVAGAGAGSGARRASASAVAVRNMASIDKSNATPNMTTSGKQQQEQQRRSSPAPSSIQKGQAGRSMLLSAASAAVKPVDVKTASSRSKQLASFILHIAERIHSCRCAVTARRFALQGQNISNNNNNSPLSIFSNLGGGGGGGGGGGTGAAVVAVGTATSSYVSNTMLPPASAAQGIGSNLTQTIVGATISAAQAISGNAGFSNFVPTFSTTMLLGGSCVSNSSSTRFEADPLPHSSFSLSSSSSSPLAPTQHHQRCQAGDATDNKSHLEVEEEIGSKAAYGERSSFTLTVGCGSIIAKLTFQVREQPLALRSVQSALERELHLARKKIHDEQQHQQQQQSSSSLPSSSSSFASFPLQNRANASTAASPSPGTTSAAALAAGGKFTAQEQQHLSDIQLLLNLLASGEPDVREKDSHWAGSVMIEDLTSISLYSEDVGDDVADDSCLEARMVQALLELPTRANSWSLLVDYKTPITIERSLESFHAASSTKGRGKMNLTFSDEEHDDEANINGKDINRSKFLWENSSEFSLATLLQADLQQNLDDCREAEKLKLKKADLEAQDAAQKLAQRQGRPRRQSVTSLLDTLATTSAAQSLQLPKNVVDLSSPLTSPRALNSPVHQYQHQHQQQQRSGSDLISSSATGTIVSSNTLIRPRQKVKRLHSLVGFRYKFDDWKFLIKRAKILHFLHRKKAGELNLGVEIGGAKCEQHETLDAFSLWDENRNLLNNNASNKSNKKSSNNNNNTDFLAHLLLLLENSSLEDELLNLIDQNSGSLDEGGGAGGSDDFSDLFSERSSSYVPSKAASKKVSPTTSNIDPPPRPPSPSGASSSQQQQQQQPINIHDDDDDDFDGDDAKRAAMRQAEKNVLLGRDGGGVDAVEIEHDEKDEFDLFLEAQHNALIDIASQGGAKGILKKQLFADEILQLETFGEIPYRIAWEATKSYQEEAKFAKQRQSRNSKVFGGDASLPGAAGGGGGGCGSSSDRGTPIKDNTKIKNMRDTAATSVNNTNNSIINNNDNNHNNNNDFSTFLSASSGDEKPWQPTSSFLVAPSRRKILSVDAKLQGQRLHSTKNPASSQRRPSSPSSGRGITSKPSSGGGDWQQQLRETYARQDLKEDKKREVNEENEKLTAASCVAYEYQFQWDI